MSVKTLPPRLSSLHEQLERATEHPALGLRYELEAMGELLERARAENPELVARLGFDTHLRSFTGTSGSSVCRCCGRPFAK
jgi:hypothetical protein